MKGAQSGVDLGVKLGPCDGDSASPRSDRRLLEAFLEQDDASAEAAFRRLVDLHAPAVLRVCRDVLGDHHQAQDAAQAVFLVLAHNAKSIRRREALGSWLHGVSLRVARRARDAEARRKKAEKRNAERTSERSRRSPMVGQPYHPELHEELSRLPEQYRLPIVLCYFEGYTQEEAARILGWPYGTVQTRLHRGRRRLREALARRDPERACLLATILGPRHSSPDAVCPEWAAETARAAVKFARCGGAGSVSPSVSQLAAATTIAPSLPISTACVLGLSLAVGCFWLASRYANEEFAGPQVKVPPIEATETIPLASDHAIVEAPPKDSVTTPTTPVAVVISLKAKPVDIASKPIPSALDRIVSPPRIVQESRHETQPPDGRELFERIWAPGDPRSHGGDGLGPVFNARSCVDCHDQGGAGGGGPSSRNIDVVTAFDGEQAAGMGFSYGFSMDFGAGTMEYRFGYDAPAEPRRSAQAVLAAATVHPGFRESNSIMLHRFGVDPAYSAWRTTIPGRHGRVEVRMSQRNPTPLFGVGLIDEIPDEAIIGAARRRSSSATQTRGRVSRVEGGQVGRFGWKAQTATVEDFVVSAAANEMGLDVPGRRQAGDPRLLNIASEGLDINQAECEALVDFVRELPPPSLSVSADPKEAASIKEGERIFRSVGCASCHLPKLGDVEGLYSDLLLHDMGAELADSSGYTVFSAAPVQALGSEKRAELFEPHAREWRTPPLWGLRDSAPYLHDGRAQTIAQAVLLHGGQGKPSAERFARLSPRRRRQVEAFLNALAVPGEQADE